MLYIEKKYFSNIYRHSLYEQTYWQTHTSEKITLATQLMGVIDATSLTTLRA